MLGVGWSVGVVGRDNRLKLQNKTTTQVPFSLKLKIVIGATDLLQNVLSRDRLQDVLLGCFLNLATHKEFVQYEIGFLKIENNVQFANL